MVAVGFALYAQRQRVIAESRALAVQAELLLTRDRSTALALALQAWHKARTSEAKDAVVRAWPQVQTLLEGHTAPITAAVFFRPMVDAY